MRERQRTKKGERQARKERCSDRDMSPHGPVVAANLGLGSVPRLGAQQPVSLGGARSARDQHAVSTWSARGQHAVPSSSRSGYAAHGQHAVGTRPASTQSVHSELKKVCAQWSHRVRIVRQPGAVLYACVLRPLAAHLDVADVQLGTPVAALVVVRLSTSARHSMAQRPKAPGSKRGVWQRHVVACDRARVWVWIATQTRQ